MLFLFSSIGNSQNTVIPVFSSGCKTPVFTNDLIVQIPANAIRENSLSNFPLYSGFCMLYSLSTPPLATAAYLLIIRLCHSVYSKDAFPVYSKLNEKTRKGKCQTYHMSQLREKRDSWIYFGHTFSARSISNDVPHFIVVLWGLGDLITLFFFLITFWSINFSTWHYNFNLGHFSKWRILVFSILYTKFRRASIQHVVMTQHQKWNYSKYWTVLLSDL